MNKIVEVEDVEFGDWEEFVTASRRKLCEDEIIVSFTKIPSGHNCKILMGKGILSQLRWTDKDKIGLFLNKADRYKWMLCVSNNGYKITDTNAKYNRKISFNWPHTGVTFTKSKRCRYEIKNSQLILYVPN